MLSRTWIAPSVIVALALAVLAAVGGPAHAAPGVQFGIEQNGGMDDSRREQILDTQQGLGSRVIRFVLRFDQVATCDPAKATPATAATSYANPCYNFALPDAVIQGAANRGMTVMLSVYGAPKWEFNGADNFTGTTDAQFDALSADLADFTQAAALRYDGKHGMPRVSQWTIWNEPNGSFFEPRYDAANKLIGPARYARMYDASARRIKLVDPTMLVGVGPTAPLARALPPITFAEAVLPELQRLGSPIDAWAHNAYMGGQSPFATTIKPPTVGLGNVDDLTAVIDRFPVAAKKPLWIAEFGYQTGGAQKALTVEEQAVRTSEVVLFAWKHPRITTFIWYSLFDDEDSADAYGFQSGLYYAASKKCGDALCPKPAAGVYRHTLWVSPVSAGKVTLWGQAHVVPASTRIYIKRTGEGWQALSNPDTATSGTVQVRLAVGQGLEAMTCDTRCGPPRTIGPVAAGGGGVNISRTKVVKLPRVRLDKASTLRWGLTFQVPCAAGCTSVARLVAQGPVSRIAAARTKPVVVGKSKVTKVAGGRQILLRFTFSARQQLRNVKSSTVTIRTFTKYASGETVVSDRPVTLS